MILSTNASGSLCAQPQMEQSLLPFQTQCMVL